MYKLFHGSEKIIETPVYGFGKTYNDYGLGFYCTESREMAMEWAVDLNRNGFVNEFSLDSTGLNILHLESTEYTILHWLAILVENRKFEMPSALASEATEYLSSFFRPDYDNVDLIIGYRADDSYFSFARDFLNGTISYRQLGNAMHLGKLGLQVVVKSEAAFQRLVFQGYEIAENRLWYGKKSRRDKKAREEYYDIEKNRRIKGDIFITRILDEEMKPNDPRLR